MKIAEWIIGAGVVLIFGSLVYAFMIDLVGVLGGLLATAVSSPTNFIALLLTLAVFYFFKKEMFNNLFVGLKEKISK